ncbi:hypothetical protein MKW98_020249 [Papaver atlanticum]|uniref:AAA+ ATPase domain-containing protein n=1 Tax=Papaver atlanticum TaxID=357466 RepID=A0AAD4XA23_9MAGN|nr:hypothetical protein MKW98_020249 [Papaver atlanticum]
MKALKAERQKKTPTKNAKRASKQPRTSYNLHEDCSSSSTIDGDDCFKEILRDNYKNLPKKQGEDIEDKNMKMKTEVEYKPKKKTKKGTGLIGSLPMVPPYGLRKRVPKSVVTTEGGLKSDDYGKVKKGPRFEDIGGIKGVLDRIRDEIHPLRYGHPELDKKLGVKPSGGILLHGPPGCGKTKLAHAIANEAGVPFYKITPAQVFSGIPSKPERTIQNLFSEAYKAAPSIIFIDEIDAIALSRGRSSHRDMETRIVTQLLTCMNEPQILGTSIVHSSSTTFEKTAGYVLVIGATNRPEALDSALRRPGRFDQEIALGILDENARAEILSLLTRNLELLEDCNLAKIASVTPGFVGADLSELVRKDGKIAKKRIIAITKCNDEVPNVDWSMQPIEAWEMEGLGISMTDFEDACKMVQPSLRREGFSPTPSIKWEDVGGLESLRREFEEYIVNRIKYPEDYEEFGVGFEQGFLLYGPPGCGKTTIAKAIANEAGSNFIYIKGPELLNKYVGETERAIRELFTRARSCSPCILFFDEVEAITTNRKYDGVGTRVVERLLTQLLIELDGGDKRNCVFVIGATNRPEVMDEAVKRPGRLGKHIYVPLPSPEERGLILKALTKNKPISEDVDIGAICRKKAYENLSGADLARVADKAAMIALKEKRMWRISGEGGHETKKWTINETHFDRAVEMQRRFYDRLYASYSA